MTRILTYLGGFTAKFWLALCALLLACNGLSYCKGRSDGKAMERATWETKLKDAQVKALEDTAKAIERANEAEGGRSTDFQASQDIINRKIEDAKDADSNALDAVFSDGV